VFIISYIQTHTHRQRHTHTHTHTHTIVLTLIDSSLILKSKHRGGINQLLHGGGPQPHRPVLGGCGHQVAGRGELDPGDDVSVAHVAEGPAGLGGQAPEHQAPVQRARG